MTLYHLYLSIPKFLSGAAGNDTGNNIEKRPDSMMLFERKNSNIHLQNDNFRTGRQTGPVRWPGFFDDSANIV